MDGPGRRAGFGAQFGRRSRPASVRAPGISHWSSWVRPRLEEGDAFRRGAIQPGLQRHAPPQNQPVCLRHQTGKDIYCVTVTLFLPIISFYNLKLLFFPKILLISAFYIVRTLLIWHNLQTSCVKLVDVINVKLEKRWNIFKIIAEVGGHKYKSWKTNG